MLLVMIHYSCEASIWTCPSLIFKKSHLRVKYVDSKEEIVGNQWYIACEYFCFVVVYNDSMFVLTIILIADTSA